MSEINGSQPPYVYSEQEESVENNQIEQYLDQDVIVVTQEIDGKHQVVGAYPPEGIDEIDNIMGSLLTSPGDSASIIYNDPKNEVIQTRDYTRDEDDGILMSETKEGENSAHMTEYTNSDGKKYAAITPKDSDVSYVYDPTTDSTYETTAPASELPSLVKDGFGEHSDGIYVGSNGESYEINKTEEDIVQSVFGQEEDWNNGGEDWNNYLSLFLEARAIHEG